MKLWKRAGSVGLSLALCAGLVLPALAHTVTIDGVAGSQEVGTVQEGVTAIENSASQSGTITMDKDESTSGVTINSGSVTLDLSGHTLTGGNDGIRVSGGGLTLQDTGPDGTGTVSGMDAGVKVDAGGTANITGGKVSGNTFGVSVVSGTATISGGTVSGDYSGVFVGSGGTADISGNATVTSDSVGVYVLGVGTANISGNASISGSDEGVFMVGGTAEISGGTVSGETGVHMYDGSFTMNGGTVGSMVEGGNAIDIYDTNIDKIAIELNGGTLYGEVPDGVNTDNVTVKDAPFDPDAPGPAPAPDPGPAPDQGPTPDPAPASDPLARPAAAMTLLEELFRRAGGSGDLWSWAVENGLIDEDGDGAELVTVALLRSILARYAEVFGGNVVAVEELTTLTGEDPSVVDNCRAVLNEFFGE